MPSWREIFPTQGSNPGLIHCRQILCCLNHQGSSLLSSSVQFSHSVRSDSLQPHELQHARPPCPSPALGIYPNSCLVSQWCHPTISSCHPLLLLPSIFPSIRVFSNESVLWISWPKYMSFSFNISPSNEPPGLISFRMDWLDLLALSRVFSNTTVQKHRFFCTQPSFWSNYHIYTWLLEKSYKHPYMDVCRQSDVSAF